MLSFLYSMLAKEWTVILASVGFDPMLGFLHQPRYGRPALGAVAPAFEPAELLPLQAVRDSARSRR